MLHQGVITFAVVFVGYLPVSMGLACMSSDISLRILCNIVKLRVVPFAGLSFDMICTESSNARSNWISLVQTC